MFAWSGSWWRPRPGPSSRGWPMRRRSSRGSTGAAVDVVSADGVDLEAFSTVPRSEAAEPAERAARRSPSGSGPPASRPTPHTLSGPVVRSVLLFAEDRDADLIVCGGSTRGAGRPAPARRPLDPAHPARRAGPSSSSRRPGGEPHDRDAPQRDLRHQAGRPARRGHAREGDRAAPRRRRARPDRARPRRHHRHRHLRDHRRGDHDLGPVDRARPSSSPASRARSPRWPSPSWPPRSRSRAAPTRTRTRRSASWRRGSSAGT